MTLTKAQVRVIRPSDTIEKGMTLYMQQILNPLCEEVEVVKVLKHRIQVRVPGTTEVYSFRHDGSDPKFQHTYRVGLFIQKEEEQPQEAKPVERVAVSCEEYVNLLKKAVRAEQAKIGKITPIGQLLPAAKAAVAATVTLQAEEDIFKQCEKMVNLMREACLL